ncbi:MAG: DNA-processing protein DprA [Pseudomonadota bacterium]
MRAARDPADPAFQRDWLRLARSENVGPASFRSLLRRFGDPGAALDALPDLAARGGAKRRIVVASRADANAELDAGVAFGARLVTLADPVYPALLAAIDPPPPLLWAKGAGLEALDCWSLGVVGARNASSLGQRFARWFAQEAVGAGFAVVSGLARGVDGAAHQGALEGEAPQGVARPPTLAVLAGGIDRPYPPQSAEIHRAVAERGLLVSEAPMGLDPTARHFPRRNRLISGLSLGVVVVEAAERSGSLITARLAAEQGREVMATPGHPFDPRAAGVNALLRDGATMVRHIGDALEALGPQLRETPAPRQGLLMEDPAEAPPHPGDPGPEARAALLNQLSLAPVPMDALFRSAGIDAAAGAAALLELELAGLVEREAGAMVRRLAA